MLIKDLVEFVLNKEFIETKIGQRYIFQEKWVDQIFRKHQQDYLKPS